MFAELLGKSKTLFFKDSLLYQHPLHFPKHREINTSSSFLLLEADTETHNSFKQKSKLPIDSDNKRKLDTGTNFICVFITNNLCIYKTEGWAIAPPDI